MDKENKTVSPQEEAGSVPARLASRRHILAGAGLGAAALAAQTIPSRSFAKGRNADGTAAALVNPLKAYPAPSFSSATAQAWPGLNSKMHPVPDCGEKSYIGKGRMTGRRALITGGDSGIGRAVAIAFAREGADVAINYLPEEESDAQEVVALIRKAGRRAVALPGDIRSEAVCKQLVKDAAAQLGSLDCLVNNAAFMRYQDNLENITPAQLEQTFTTNVFAVIWLTQAAVPLMAPGSCIVNTTSVEAYLPDQELVDYAATKAAVSNLTRSLGKQLLPKGIRVNAVAPGPFWTPLQTCCKAPEKWFKDCGAGVPYHRPGQPVEIAPVYVTLASTEASYVTSQVWEITGGMT